MDMQVSDCNGADADAGAKPVTGELTFSWLFEQVQGYAAHSIYPKPSRLEKGGTWVGVVATGLGLLTAALPGSLFPAGSQILILMACLLIEVTGFLLSFVLMLKREGRQYLKPRLTHAAEMDGDFAYWAYLVDQLRTFPRHDREQRLRFANSLRHSMTDRMGLVFGGLQKLGFFPVLVALYLQLRGWQWGDWAGAFDVNPAAAILIFLMVLLYALGWVLVGIRTRLETYVNLLEASLADQPPSH
ncbi:hypothetical protein ABB28_02950 [Stenotrophomonas chelatiphaga]|jgi:hypothetical protein|uniref:Transmembrane protein n=1 Tax=Stenotrophomonas chelatiphaga TaxID=517011 RepID=A0A0R0DCP8_9GAMM|nr:hypothetical protein [Stenotrophomonas chelatiphaga]KRG76418.1 hypothetical protein ABB28_02950 [Stenotrophomonas chelatiphaga]